jgi:hypothetical protein
MNLAAIIPTMAVAARGASTLTQAERAAELQPGSDAITAARRGQRKMRAQHWMALADVANVAEALAKLGIASNLAAEIQAAHAALADISAWLPATLHAQLNPRKTILQPVDRGIDFVGHVFKPWAHTTRRRTVAAALRRIEHIHQGELGVVGNSYFGLLRQATHSHTARTQLANALRRRGKAVKADLTKTYGARP